MTLSSHVKHGEVEIQEVLRNSKKNGKICFLSVVIYKLLHFLNTLENSVLSVSCWNLHDYYFVFVGKRSKYFELKGLLKLTKTFMYLMFQTVTKRIKRMMQAFVAGKGSKRMKRNTIKTKMHQKRKKQINRSWGIEEKETVLLHFSSDSRSQHVPGKKREDCLEVFPCLKSRSWKDVKYWVKNRIDRIKKTKQ